MFIAGRWLDYATFTGSSSSWNTYRSFWCSPRTPWRIRPPSRPLSKASTPYTCVPTLGIYELFHRCRYVWYIGLTFVTIGILLRKKKNHLAWDWYVTLCAFNIRSSLFNNEFHVDRNDQFSIIYHTYFDICVSRNLNYLFFNIIEIEPVNCI